MHEFSICERILDVVLAELERAAPARLLRTRVVVGRLHQIVPEQLRFAYQTLTRDTAAHGSELDIAIAPVVVRCRQCGWQGELEPPIFRCRECRALEVDLLGGRELYLEQLEVETDDPA